MNNFANSKWCLLLQSSILTHNTSPHGMTKNHMRLLTEQELQSIYGGNIFTSIWNWLKNHFTLYVENEPQIGPNGGVRGPFTI